MILVVHFIRPLFKRDRDSCTWHRVSCYCEINNVSYQTDGRVKFALFYLFLFSCSLESDLCELSFYDCVSFSSLFVCDTLFNIIILMRASFFLTNTAVSIRLTNFDFQSKKLFREQRSYSERSSRRYFCYISLHVCSTSFYMI